MNTPSVVYVGVDMAKASFVAAAHQDGQSQIVGEFANQPSGFEALAQALGQQSGTIHLLMEPTASYHLPLVAYAHEQDWRLSLPNPKRVADWAKGTGRRAKSDTQDAWS